MLIGEVARRTGASLKAIRLYEALGLLGRISRSGSYRVYSDDNVRQVQMIRQAQALGFRLSELAPVLPAGGDAPDWDRLLQHLNHKRDSIRREMTRLKRLDAQLAQIAVEIQECTAADPAPDVTRCPQLASHPDSRDRADAGT